MLTLPQEVIGLIVGAVVQDPDRSRWNREAYRAAYAAALEQAGAVVDASLVCRSWSLAPSRDIWQRLWNNLTQYDRHGERTWQCYRAQVYCHVRDSQLTLAIRAFVKQEKLVYRSPKAQRRYDAEKLGMRKLIKLGKEKLWSHKKQQFMALSCEWQRVHQRSLDIANALWKRDCANKY
jgi:hypothetical protein